MRVSFEDWASVEGPGLKRAAMLLCRDEHEADDLVQDTLVRVFSKWARIADLERPTGYAHRTLINLYLSRWRRLRLDRSRMHLFAPSEHLVANDDIDQVADRGALTTWLQSLGPKQRAAIVWRYYGDLTVEEIADLLNCRESTVRTQLSRGLANMRRIAAQPEHVTSRNGAQPDVR